MDFKVIDLGVEFPNQHIILVVDDEPSIHGVIFDTLSDDYRLISANNGKEGIKMAGHATPHLILMDVMMPDVGGYEAAQMLRDDPNTKDIPIIMMTARDFDSTTIQMMKHEPNVAGFLAKPFRPKNLRAMVKKVLGQKD